MNVIFIYYYYLFQYKASEDCKSWELLLLLKLNVELDKHEKSVFIINDLKATSVLLLRVCSPEKR